MMYAAATSRCSATPNLDFYAAIIFNSPASGRKPRRSARREPSATTGVLNQERATVGEKPALLGTISNRDQAVGQAPLRGQFRISNLVVAAINTMAFDARCIPARLRCSALTYAGYSRFSRLALRKPQPSRCETEFTVMTTWAAHSSTLPKGVCCRRRPR